MRKADYNRKTNETSIDVTVNIDGTGKYSINTPYGFLNHMLELFSKHSSIDIDLKAEGDTQVDPHHTVEDTGISLGTVIEKALAEKKGIERYGFSMLPMDEARCDVSVDLSGRPHLVYNVNYPVPWEGEDDFDYSLIKEFLKGFAENLKATIHVNLVYGENNHHIAEAVFKGIAKALKQAVKITGKDIPSTKGVI